MSIRRTSPSPGAGALGIPAACPGFIIPMLSLDVAEHPAERPANDGKAVLVGLIQILTFGFLPPKVVPFKRITCDLKPEKVNRRKCHQCRATLQHQYKQSLFGSPWQPFESEKHDDRYLPCHKDLPDVGCRTFVSLRSRSKDGNINNHCGERRTTLPKEEKHSDFSI